MGTSDLDREKEGLQQDGIITRCEIMQGLSFLAKFKPLNEFLGKDMKGRSIYEFLDDMKDFDKKQKKKYKGYINAFEALDQRLQDTKLEEDQKEAEEELIEEIQNDQGPRM